MIYAVWIWLMDKGRPAPKIAGYKVLTLRKSNSSPLNIGRNQNERRVSQAQFFRAILVLGSVYRIAMGMMMAVMGMYIPDCNE